MKAEDPSHDQQSVLLITTNNQPHNQSLAKQRSLLLITAALVSVDWSSPVLGKPPGGRINTNVTIHYECVITALVTMMRLSRRSVWSLAVCVTAVMWAVEVEPRVTSQAATYKVDRER